MTEVGQRIVLVRGGNGGFGNAYFKSSTNQAPRHANPGLEGQEMWIWLRLKLIADAGLVGLPNAGKSTFLAAVSRAKPKIADYPFTTLNPNLGVVEFDGESFVIADIPGLIEGAHEGAGLGDRFLGHVERTNILLHLVDGTSETIADDYHTIKEELRAYGQGLDEKPVIIALNKCDALTEDLLVTRKAELEEACGQSVMTLSGVAGINVREVLHLILKEVKAARAAEKAAEQEAEPEGWRP